MAEAVHIQGKVNDWIGVVSLAIAVFDALRIGWSLLSGWDWRNSRVSVEISSGAEACKLIRL